MKTNRLRFLHIFSVYIVFFSTFALLVFIDENNEVYAQNDSSQFWKTETTCEKAEKILATKNKSFEQLDWISRDAKEREKLVSSLTSDELKEVLACAKSNLPDLKSEIITKKIGFFEGQNAHQVNGKARVITIENKDYLRFENFEIGFSGDKNPDLHVYLATQDDFSNNIYLEKLKTKVGSKNYPLQGIDIDDYDTVIIYDEISKEIFATISLSNPSLLVDMFMDLYHNLQNDVDEPKIDSDIIYTKTGTLDGSADFQTLGRIETPFEEDEAELKFERFEISEGFDFHLYATEDGQVKKPGDWTFGPDNLIYVSNTNTNEILRYDATTGEFIDVFVAADNNGGLQGPKDLVFSPDN